MILRPIGGLSVPIQLDFIWARDNASPVLARFIEVLRTELR